MFGEEWDNGEKIAHFNTNTSGPEAHWEVEMRRCHTVSDPGREYLVVLDPFAVRLMWFNNDRFGRFEAVQAFNHLTSLAMFDADSSWPEQGNVQ